MNLTKKASFIKKVMLNFDSQIAGSPARNLTDLDSSAKDVIPNV